jgi:hypothetical protein
VKATLLLLFLLLFLCAALAQDGRARAPGLRQAQQAEIQAEKDIPPPVMQRSHKDYAKLGHEADELSKIAQTIPSDVDQAAKGVFPKDMIEKLKQIEKLSKHLRSELNP